MQGKQEPDTAKIEQARLLRASGLSLAKISKEINIPKTTIYRWERNGWKAHKENPKPKGPPKGSKNGFKTGLYEDISYTAMTEEEKLLYLQVDTDPAGVLIRNLKALSIRKLRMIRLRENIEEQIKEEEEHNLTEEGGNLAIPRKVREKTVRKQALLDKKIALEDAITRVEDLERRNAEALYRMQKDQKADEKKRDSSRSITFEFKRG